MERGDALKKAGLAQAADGRDYCAKYGLTITAPTGLVIFLAIVWLVLPNGTFAQGETTSAIVGEVSDASGSDIAGASVTIVNVATGLKRGATTDEAGRFNFAQLIPGTYVVRVEAEGFEPQKNEAVPARAGTEADGPFHIKGRTSARKH